MFSFDLFNNLQIRTRIAALGGLGLVAIVILTAAYWIGDMRRTAAYGSKQEFALLAERAQHVQIFSLQLRRREKDFLIRKDMKYVDKYQKDHKALMDSLETIRGMDVAGPIADNIDALARGGRTHADQFAKVVALQRKLGLNEKSGLEGKLRKAVHNAESKLEEAHLESLTIKMLMMRRHEKDFMLRSAEKYIGRVNKRHAEFKALLAAASISQDFRNQVSANMDIYVRDFKIFAKTSLAFKNEVKKLSVIFAGMNPHFDALAKAAAEGETTGKIELETARKTTQLAIVIVGAVVLGLGLLFSLLIGRSVSSPLGAMTEVMTRLAEGRIDVDVPATKNKDEIGDIARSVLVFKQNAEERIRLEAEQEEEHAAKKRRMAVLDELITKFEA